MGLHDNWDSLLAFSLCHRTLRPVIEAFCNSIYVVFCFRLLVTDPSSLNCCCCSSSPKPEPTVGVLHLLSEAAPVCSSSCLQL